MLESSGCFQDGKLSAIKVDETRDDDELQYIFSGTSKSYVDQTDSSSAHLESPYLEKLNQSEINLF